MTEKPLHVRVAEALGTTVVLLRDNRKCCDDSGWLTDYGDHVPRYDTDWSATGPLIEKYGITLSAACGFQGWRAWNGEGEDDWSEDYRVAEAPTPVLAVCNLILALREAGKLETTEAANK